MATRAKQTPAERNAATMQRLYAAFAKRDGKDMAACYHDDASFSDPVFPDLHGGDIGRMWRMLCKGAEDLTIVASCVAKGDDAGTAQWEARYTFGATGRKVHNVIRAQFTFKDGLILAHRDQFSFWRWSSQALGFKGKLLGWTPIVKRKVRAQARRRLDAFR